MFYSQIPFNSFLKIKADHRHLKIFTTSSVTPLLLQFTVNYWGIWADEILVVSTLITNGMLRHKAAGQSWALLEIALDCVFCVCVQCRKWTSVVVLFLNPSLDCLDLCKPPEKRVDWEEFKAIFPHYFVYRLRMGPNVWKSV